MCSRAPCSESVVLVDRERVLNLIERHHGATAVLVGDISHHLEAASPTDAQVSRASARRNDVASRRSISASSVDRHPRGRVRVLHSPDRSATVRTPAHSILNATAASWVANSASAAFARLVFRDAAALHDGIDPLRERVGEPGQLFIPIDQRLPAVERPIEDERLKQILFRSQRALYTAASVELVIVVGGGARSWSPYATSTLSSGEAWKEPRSRHPGACTSCPR